MADGQSADFVPRATPKPPTGRRQLCVQERVSLEDIKDSRIHQDMMAALAARAVRWFAENMAEVEWHTLRFEVVRLDTDEEGRELGQTWRWSVWIH